MSMSTHVVGFMERDEEWERYEKVWLACDQAGVPIPKEVDEFFKGKNPCGKPGAEVDIEDAVREYGSLTTAVSGYEVDIRKLPTNVKTIRFYNSW